MCVPPSKICVMRPLMRTRVRSFIRSFVTTRRATTVRSFVVQHGARALPPPARCRSGQQNEQPPSAARSKLISDYVGVLHGVEATPFFWLLRLRSTAHPTHGHEGRCPRGCPAHQNAFQTHPTDFAFLLYLSLSEVQAGAWGRRLNALIDATITDGRP